MRVVAVTFVVALALMLSVGWKNDSYERGRSDGKEEIIQALIDGRYDAQHQAVFANGQQQEILRYAAAATLSLRMLRNAGHFKGVRAYLYEEAFKYDK